MQKRGLVNKKGNDSKCFDVIVAPETTGVLLLKSFFRKQNTIDNNSQT